LRRSRYALEQWQRLFFDDALTVTDEETLEPYYRTVALVVARKNGKTQMLGGVGALPVV